MNTQGVRRVLVVINGDTRPDHLANTRRTIARAKEAGYEIHVLNPTELAGAQATFYAKPSQAQLMKLIAGLGTDQNDQVVLHVTGHGAERAGHSGVVIGQDYVSHQKFHALFRGVQYGSMTVVMDQCVGADAAKLWHAPRRLFIAPGWKGQLTSCVLFTPHFFASQDKILAESGDVNHDGAISYFERFSYAATRYMRQQTDALPVFLPGSEYRDVGLELEAKQPNFSSHITRVDTRESLEKALQKVRRPGEFAVVYFSASWCGACKSYSPQFQKIAEASPGNVQFVQMHTDSRELEWMDKYDVHSLPSVVLVDHLGRHVKVNDRLRPLSELDRIALSDGATLHWARQHVAATMIHQRWKALRVLATLAKRNPQLMRKNDLPALRTLVDKGDLLGMQSILVLVMSQPTLFEDPQRTRREVEGALVRRRNASWLLRLSILNHRMKRYAQALSVLKEILTHDPNFVKAHLMRLTVNLAIRDFASALVDAQAVVALDPTHARAWGEMALIYLQLERLADAERAARRALQIDPSELTAHRVLANSLAKRGQAEEALQHSVQGLKFNPDDAILLYIKTDMQLTMGRPTSMRDWNLLIAQSPERPGIHNNRGTLHLQRGDRAAARKDFSSEVQKGEYVARPRWNIVSSYLMPKQIRTAAMLRPNRHYDDVLPRVGLEFDWDVLRFGARNHASLGVMLGLGWTSASDAHALDSVGGMSLTLFDEMLRLQVAAGYQWRVDSQAGEARLRDVGVMQYGLEYTHWFTRNLGVGPGLRLIHELSGDVVPSVMPSMHVSARIW